MSRPSLSTVIVAYNSAGVIGQALDSLSGVDEIICVDNASEDDLAGAVSRFDVTLIRNDVNRGFGTACNQGAARATSDFILFINPDVVLGQGAIEALFAAVDRYPDAQVLVPRTVDGEGRLWFHDSSRFTPRARLPLGLKREIVGDCCLDFVDGGAFMIRAELFREIGGFDENIFLYYEDDDLSLRLRARGAPVVFVSDALATHAIGQSTRPTAGVRMRTNFHKKRSEIYMARKLGRRYSRAADLAGHVAKVLLYALTFNGKRLSAAAGRLGGILSTFRAGNPQV